MHAPVLKHTPLNQIVGLALVLGLAASLALTAAMVTRSNDHDASVTAPQADISLLAKQQRYYDAKMGRIDAMDAAAGAQYVPADAYRRHSAMDRADWLFYEWNTILPASDANLSEPDAGAVGVDWFQTNRSFAPTAMDLFVTEAALQSTELSIVPGDVDSIDVLTYERIKFLELNVTSGDIQPLLPPHSESTEAPH